MRGEHTVPKLVYPVWQEIVDHYSVSQAIALVGPRLLSQEPVKAAIREVLC